MIEKGAVLAARYTWQRTATALWQSVLEAAKKK
jgi:hypothetical protein